MPDPGVTLSDRYQLSHVLGAGGMGEVWQATDLLLNRVVAVKILRPALAADENFTARFLAEARTMAALHHPGIVDIYDYGSSGDGQTVYLVMECVAGEPLSELIERTGRLAVPQTLDIIGQTARALAAAHGADIVHRDIKPANLLLTADGTVKLADFGVARTADSTSSTGPGAVLGTARYMAPEQALGEQVTAAADLYSLGAVAYNCLAGHPPFDGASPVEVALHHVQDDPPPLPGDIPPEVRALVDTAMAKDPAQRFPSALAFAEAIGVLAAAHGLGTAAALRAGSTDGGNGNGADRTQRQSFAVGAAAVPLLRDPAGDTFTELPAEPRAGGPKYAVAAAVLLLLLAIGGFLAWSLTNRDTPSSVPGSESSSTPSSSVPTSTSTPSRRPATTGTTPAATVTVATTTPAPPPTTVKPTTAAPTTPAVTTSPPPQPSEPVGTDGPDAG